MKKILGVLAMAVMLVASTVTPAKSQTFVTLAQGRSQDTSLKSTTTYTPVVNLVYSAIQDAFVQVAVDSISGAPAGVFIVQHSVDGAHWKSYTGDTALTWTNTGWSTKSVAKITTNGRDTNSFIAGIASQVPFYGNYLRVKLTTTSATQKIRYWIAVKSYNYSH